MKLLAILGLFIVSACATQPQQPTQAFQQSWERGVAQTGGNPVHKAFVVYKEKDKAVRVVKVTLDLSNCQTCGFIVVDNSAHVFWPYMGTFSENDAMGIGVSHDISATVSSVIDTFNEPKHIYFYFDPKRDKATVLANFAKKYGFEAKGTQLTIKNVPIIM